MQCSGFSLWCLLLWSRGSRYAGSGVVVQGFIALQHVESSQTRDLTCVSCVGMQILIHGTTREVLVLDFLIVAILTSVR